MYRIWKKKTDKAIRNRIFEALKKNVNYRNQHVLGIPASHLDKKVFSQDKFFLKDAPYISALVQNPNHIGCHTTGTSLSYFKGTQEVEKELIEICAVDIFGGEPEEQDGYVAAGGTEANMQAIWIYRNFFMWDYSAGIDEIAILCNEDTHYSVDKAANVFLLDIIKVPVDFHSREISYEGLSKVVAKAISQGKKYFIVVANMMTTMFGSVDDVDLYARVLDEQKGTYKIHIDGAFGGFYFPFTQQVCSFSFKNPNITSFTIDAHKMAQAPYGTGVFLIRKDYMKYARTEEAEYIDGEDSTLIGSRSGANAIAVWMILAKNGPYGWEEKIFILQKRTKWMCQKLTHLGIEFYRHPRSNIITILGQYISKEIAHEFDLMPDSYKDPKWYKIVVMDHVSIEKLIQLLEAIEAGR